MRERWPNERKSSGRNQRALRSSSGFLRSITPSLFFSCRSALQSPAEHGAALDGAEDQILYHEPDQDHREQAGKDGGNVELISILEDEPTQPALSGRYAED